MVLAVITLHIAMPVTAQYHDCEDLKESTSWRVVALTTDSGWAWDVMSLKFVTDLGGAVHLDENCSAIHSGSVSDADRGNIPGYEPENAFRKDRTWWGGRQSDGQFYLGIQCAEPRLVKSVKLMQHGRHRADNIQVQYWSNRIDNRTGTDGWVTLQDVPVTRANRMQKIWEACVMDTAPITIRPAASSNCDNTSVQRSTSWRVVASTTHSGWAWDVTKLKFVTDIGAIELDEDCRAIQSGSVSDVERGNILGY